MNLNEVGMGYMKPNEGGMGYMNPNECGMGYMNPNECGMGYKFDIFLTASRGEFLIENSPHR